MTVTREFVAGSILLLCAVAGIYLAAGGFGLITVLVMVILARIALHLFNKKSLRAKTGGVIIYSDLLFKLLMPKTSRVAIQELEKTENQKSSKV